MSDGIKRRIERHSPSGSERELFFCVIGGSPGNYGVLTHVTIRVLKDSDYPN